MKRVRRVAVATAVIVATVVVLGARAEAASGPTFTGGAGLADYSGNRHPSAAFDGSETLVVWEQLVSGQHDIYGAIVNADTTHAEPAFKIATGSKDQINPDVAWGGSSWLVVWEVATSASDHDIKARRVSKAGTPTGDALDVSATTANQTGPTVAGSTNDRFLVTWVDTRHTATGDDIYAGRVSGSSALDGSGVRLSFDKGSLPEADASPDVAWNGTSYMTVWTSKRDDDDFYMYTDTRNPNGTRVDFRNRLSSSGALGSVSIASDGNDFLAATQTGDLIILHAGNNPQPGPFDVFYVHGFGAGRPAIAFNGIYLLAYTTHESEGSDVLWGYQVKTDGTLVDRDGFLYTDNWPSNGTPALTVGGTQSRRFDLAWDPTPSGEASGVVVYGVRFAPK